LEMSDAVVPVVTVTSAVTSWPTATVPKSTLYGLKLASGWMLTSLMFFQWAFFATLNQVPDGTTQFPDPSQNPLRYRLLSWRTQGEPVRDGGIMRSVTHDGYPYDRQQFSRESERVAIGAQRRWQPHPLTSRWIGTFSTRATGVLL
jgi:hypothetical protein